MNMPLLSNRHDRQPFVRFLIMKGKDIEDLKRQNLIRLIKRNNLKQYQLAEMIGITPEYLNKLIKGHRGLSDDIQARLCNALKLRPDEFYIDNETPILQDNNEQELMNIYREAKDLGTIVAEKIPEYGKFVIKETKKSKTVAPRKSKGVRHKKS